LYFNKKMDFSYVKCSLQTQLGRLSK
jgi:hypothetical protein